MAKTKISQFDATAANNTDLNSISIAEGTAPSNINNAIRELMSQLADLNLGNEVLSTLKIDNLHLDGNTIVTLDTNGDLNLTPNGTGAVTIAKADINGGTIDGTPIGASSASTGAFSTLSASSTVGLGSSVTISGGNIDGVIGANTPAAITGTVITANTNFAGNLTGNVTGTVDGVVGGTTPAAVTGTTITANTKFVGAIDGNVTATSGTSTFNNVTINGTLDMDSTTSQTITGLASPSGSTDAATKGYVDTEVSGLVDSAPAALNTLNELAAALGDDASFSTTVTNSIAAKLPLAGGTMTGDINANSNTVSGLKAPSSANDATTKTYVDTADALKLNLSGGTLSGNLAMGSNKVTGLAAPTADGDAARKKYVDDIAGSGTAAATSASAAATSATASATSATASASSATASAASATSAAASLDSFDDRYLGAKSSAPTVDNDGDALVTGALYWNTSSNDLYVWNGSAWEQGAFSTGGVLSNVVEDTTPQLGGDLDAQGKDIEDVGIVSADGIAGIYGATGSPVTYTVTVASKTAAHPYNGDGSSSAYFLNGIESPALQLQGVDGTTANTEYFYKFDQAHSSNSGHPLRFYKDAAKAEAYTSGVTTNGTAGSSGAFTTIAVDDATPNVLYYECSSHAYMGNYVTTPATSVQGLDAELTAIAGLTSAADKGIQFTGSGSAGVYDLTAAGKALLDDSDAAAQRTTLGLGSAATTASTDYATAAQGTKADNAAAKASNLSDLASASTARTNLGLGSAATLTAGTSANNAVQLDGSAKLPAVDGSALTGLASGGTVDMVADGAIAIRKPVILTSAGKAKEIAAVPDAAISAGLGSAVAVTSAGSSGRYTASDSGVNGQRVIACRSDTIGSSNYNINLRVATVNTTDLKTVTYSGLSTLSVGTAVTGIGVIYHEDAGKYICTWRGANGYLYGCVLTVSGTGSTATVSAGTTLAIVSADIVGWASDCMCYDTVNDFVIITYEEYFARTSSLTISGTTLSVASAVSLASDIAVKGIPKCAWNKYHEIVVYIFQNTSEDLYYNLATPSTYGYIPVAGSNKGLVDNAQNWNDYTTCLSCDPDSGETVIIGADGDNNRSQGGNTIWGTSGTRSGFVITWGTFTQFSDVIFMANNAAGGSALKPIENGKMIYFMGTQTSSPTLPYRPVYTIVTTSGTSISYTTPASAGSQQSYGVTYLSLAVNFSKTQALMSWGDTGSADAITSVTLLQADANGDGSTSNLTSTNYLGVSAEAISNTATGKIHVISGLSTGHSSLTIGSNYFTTDAGAIATSGTTLIGKALSATEILLKT